VTALAPGNASRIVFRLSGGPDPVHDPLRVLERDERVDQDRVTLAADQ
jgi:hypothetical protein